MKLPKTQLKKYIQVVPRDLFLLLKKAADEKGIDVDLEIALRLLARFSDEETCGSASYAQAILARKFSAKDAFAQSKYRQEQWLYLYELEKLRLFVRFEAHLPKSIKEQFSLIDVKSLIQSMRNELRDESQ